MQIKIKAVSLDQKNAANGKTYQIAEVVYGDERGETKTKKLVSFSNPAVFAVVRDAKGGDTVSVTTVKNEKTGFWDWTSAAKSDGTEAVADTPAARTTSKSSYETTEERALRQRLIVRQSSLSNAIEFLGEAEDVNDTERVLGIAETFAEWVYKSPVEQQELGDIPF